MSYDTARPSYVPKLPFRCVFVRAFYHHFHIYISEDRASTAIHLPEGFAKTKTKKATNILRPAIRGADTGGQRPTPGVGLSAVGRSQIADRRSAWAVGVGAPAAQPVPTGA